MWHSLPILKEPQDHPAPIVRNVKVESLSGSTVPIVADALIDTGCAVTVIPLSIAVAVGMPVGSMVQISIFGGHPTQVPTFYVALDIPAIGKITVNAIAVERKTIILGRDALKDVIFIMDSKSSRFFLGRGSFVKRKLMSWFG